MDNAVSAYNSILKSWPKKAGPKPKMIYIKNVVKLGHSTLGSKDTVAVAMAMRDKGVTQRECVVALGGFHRNKILSLARDNLIKLIKTRSSTGMNYKVLPN
jgi:hypothetical protein